MSRAEVSPEGLMSVAKSVAKGEGIQNQSSCNDQSYGDNSGYASYNENSGGQSYGQDQYVGGGDQQSYNETQPQQQQQYHVSEPYENEQQGNYFDSSGTNNNNMTSNAPPDKGREQFASYSMPQDYQDSSSNMQGTQGGQGMQASGKSFGNGFDEGFGQGLAGGPDGSQPHSGVEVIEQSEPGYESRDTDLHTTGSARGGGYETHQHHRDTFETKSVIQGS